MTLQLIRASRAAVPIDEKNGTGASGVIEFATIPQTYRHLLIEGLARSDVAGTSDTIRLTFDASPNAADYSREQLMGTGASPTSQEAIGSEAYLQIAACPGGTSTANLHGGFTAKVYEYSNTSICKCVYTQNVALLTNSSGNFQNRTVAGVWIPTTAVTLIRLTMASGNWTTTSRVTLYGIPA